MESDNSQSSQRGFKETVAKAKEIGRTARAIAAEEVMSWDVFRWTVIALLVLNSILILAFYGAGSSHDRADFYVELSALRTEVDKELRTVKAELSAELVAVQFGLQQSGLQTEPEPTGSINTPSVPVPTRAPQRQ